jgi:indolepyruvate ferredoxin oxidoreductase alpha subunit
MCTRVAHSQSVVETKDRVELPTKTYEKNIAKYVMAPANAIRRHPVVEQRLKDIETWSETSGINRIEMGGTEIGIITSSTCYQYAKEVFGEEASILKLGMVNPLPSKMIKDFASKVKKLVVIEELDPIIENHCKSLGLDVHGKDMFPICGEFSQNLIAKAFGKEVPACTKLEENIPVRPPIMCAGCPHRGMFYALSKLKVTVLGDIGCYTLGSVAPLSTMDMTLCMGASISGLHGFNKALGKDAEAKTVAIIGDSTFMHSGMTGLATVAYNQSNSTIIIVDNSITGMTGHQQNPTTGKNLYGEPAGKVDLEALVKALGINSVKVVDPYNIAECEQVLKEELAKDEPSVIISRRPCALLKEVKHEKPLIVSQDKCKSCKMCMKIGCPAISMKGGKAKIDETLCVGCGVCTQMCKFDAINKA